MLQSLRERARLRNFLRKLRLLLEARLWKRKFQKVRMQGRGNLQWRSMEKGTEVEKHRSITEVVLIKKQKLKCGDFFPCPIFQLLTNYQLTRLEIDNWSHPQGLFTETTYAYFSAWVLWSLRLYWETLRRYAHFNRRSAKPWKNVLSKCHVAPLG